MTACSIVDCDRRVHARGWCTTHYSRWFKRGDATQALPRRWVGDKATYGAVHDRLRNALGSAKLRLCVRCDGPAREWAYDHSDPDEKHDELKGAYSLDPKFYVPMCISCHRKFDYRRRFWER